MKVLELKGISKSMDGRTLFGPFDLTVLYGERVAMVGPNGSGKTTLLRIIAGLIPPDGGSIRMGPSVLPGYYTQEHESLPLDHDPYGLCAQPQAPHRASRDRHPAQPCSFPTGICTTR